MSVRVAQEPEFKAALADMAAARDDLLAVVSPLSPDDLRAERPGGWSVGRVLRHLIESEAIYLKLLAHQTGRTAPEITADEPRDGADAAAQLAETRASVLRIVDGIDEETLFRLTRIGHEEYSPLSVLENIASHDRDHRGQIAELVPPRQRAAQPAPHTGVRIRAATEADLVAINDVYNHYIVNTAITFDIEPYTMDERRAWFAKFAPAGRHRLFVAEDGGRVAGFAGTTQFRTKAAYDTTVETTVYCAPAAAGRGIGSALYATLFDALRGEDIRMAVAGITLPNEASVRLHERFGFARAGIFRAVGRKFGRYWDVQWMEREMRGSRG